MEKASSKKGSVISWFRRGAVLLKSKNFSDVCVRVDNSSFPCHKIVLANASEFFEKLFQRDGLETGEVVLAEATPDIFEKFLNYVYTWDEKPLRDLDPEDLFSLLKISNMWMAFEVEEICTNLLLDCCSTMQAYELVNLYEASYLLSKTSIMEGVIKNLKTRFTNKMDTPAVLNLGIDCFSEYFQHTDLLDTSKRFTLAESWIQKNCSKTYTIRLIGDNDNPNNFEPDPLWEKVTKIVQSIQFNNMSLPAFYSGPAQSNLLAESSKLKVMYSIANNILGYHNHF